MIRYQSFQLFPTTVVKFDVSDVITQERKVMMIQDIDDMERQNLYLQVDESTPNLQSRPILFNANYPYIKKECWQTLQQTFMDCCFSYLQTIKDFCNNQDALDCTGSRAWFYKSNNKTSGSKEMPKHTHYPSFLSGVFYLEVPGDDTYGGTELCDPRGPAERAIRMVEIMPTNLSWLIFPGWMEHASGRWHSDQSRYVVAADCYVKVS